VGMVFQRGIIRKYRKPSDLSTNILLTTFS
jgi:hypothetical protein